MSTSVPSPMAMGISLLRVRRCGFHRVRSIRPHAAGPRGRHAHPLTVVPIRLGWTPADVPWPTVPTRLRGRTGAGHTGAGRTGAGRTGAHRSGAHRCGPGRWSGPDGPDQRRASHAQGFRSGTCRNDDALTGDTDTLDRSAARGRIRRTNRRTTRRRGYTDRCCGNAGRTARAGHGRARCDERRCRSSQPCTSHPGPSCS